MNRTGRERFAMRDFRKHTNWYMSGYPVGPEVRRRLSQISSLLELDGILDELDPTTDMVAGGERIKRGHSNGRSRCRSRTLPRLSGRARHPRRPRRHGIVGRLSGRWRRRSCWHRRPRVGSFCCAPVGIEFTVVPADVDESLLPGEKPVDYVERVAHDKAMAVVAKLGMGAAGDVVVLAADTTVDVDGEILGKPIDDSTPGACCICCLAVRTRSTLRSSDGGSTGRRGPR
jgi:hypothetical protein